MNTLIAKLARASAKVGALATDKTNTAQNYAYISADKILQRAGDALAAEGVVIVPSITSEAVQEVTYTDGYGKTKTRYDASVVFSMLITDGESELTAPWTGRGSDFSVPDKATYKAITSGHKYLLMKLLNIGVGNEDGEHDEAAETAQDARKPTQAKQPARTQNVKPAPATQPTEPTAQEGRTVTPLSENTHRRLHALGVELYQTKTAWDEARPGLVQWASKGAVTSSSDLSETEARTLIAGIEKRLADAAQAKLDGATPEERGAKPATNGKPTAGQRMASRMQPA